MKYLNLFLILVIALLNTGCGATKKLVKGKTVEESRVKSEESQVISQELKVATQEKTEVVEVDYFDDFLTGTLSLDTGVVDTLESTGLKLTSQLVKSTGGKYKIKFTAQSKPIIRHTYTSTQKDSTAQQEVIEKTESKQTTEIQSETKTKDNEITRKGMSWRGYVFLAIVIIVMMILGYLSWKKL